MSRPLSNPEEGPRKRLDVRVTDPMREHLKEIQRREGLASQSDVIDWLIRRDRAETA